ncbi:MAG: hypothetical protein GXP47_07310, partial [Acidobacteria bacterium]|nr:hypothetical protein [Acidobacteriota bacterium]
MRILKFGGTSVADPERVSGVARIVSEARTRGPVAVVVSALAGVTEELTRLARSSARPRPRSGDGRQKEEILAAIQGLARRHRQLAAAVASPGEVAVLTNEVDTLCSQLADLVRGIVLVGECSARTLDAVLSHGELLSATIMAAALRRGGVEA